MRPPGTTDNTATTPANAPNYRVEFDIENGVELYTIFWDGGQRATTRHAAVVGWPGQQRTHDHVRKACV